MAFKREKYNVDCMETNGERHVKQGGDGKAGQTKECEKKQTKNLLLKKALYI